MASIGAPVHSPFPHPVPAPPADRLAREAEARIAPILRRAGEKGAATVMYLALLELERSYPGLPPHELEVLLRAVIRRGG